jgi:general secretion pathway protein I
MGRLNASRGFTLIEVVVALAISGWVLGSAFWVVDRYASQRIELRDRFYANQVGWNQLISRYQQHAGWAAESAVGERGSELAGGHRWLWQLASQPTVGAQLVRYQVSVRAAAESPAAAAPVLYLGAPQ